MKKLIFIAGYGRSDSMFQEQRDLFEHIVYQSNKPIDVDSSKTARWCVGRPLALK